MDSEVNAARIVRPANLADAGGAVDVLRSSITVVCVEDHQNDATTLKHWLRNKTVEEFERWLLDPSNFVAISHDGAEVCGVGLIGQSGHIRLCYVRPDRQRCGVGRAVLSALERQALRWGMNEIRLTSSATARAFYEKQGYTREGESVPAFGVVRGYPYYKRLTEPAVQLGRCSRRGPGI
jgi:GNAT superfamily N-acetyltransferase